MPIRYLHQAVKNSNRRGTISNSSAEFVARSRQQEISVPPLTKVKTDSIVFTTSLYDESGSMGNLKHAVIDCQPLLLETLRGSAVCKQGGLFVSQRAFHVNTRPLNHFEPLNSMGNDHVVRLSSSNYNPVDQRTALYDAVHDALNEVLVNLDYAEEEGFLCKFILAVLTDGMDNESSIKSSDVKRLVLELRAKGVLHSSVVLGVINEYLTPDQLQKTRDDMGFCEAVSLGATPQEIRRAFLLMSQRATNTSR
jgi:hypothetical protein